MAKVLFILKRREDYNGIIHSQIGLSTGLYNSASFVNDMLKAYKIESNLAVVIDNNDIDREVSKYKPTHVVIEALWVTPSKFAVLEKLHPNVKVIMVGDFRQLPVVNDRIKGDYSKSLALKEICDYNQVALTKCRRSDVKLFTISQNVEAIEKSDFGSKKTYKNICFTNATRRFINNECMNRFANLKRKYIKVGGLKISEGMPIICKHTIDKYKLINNEFFTVESVDCEKVILKRDDGESIEGSHAFFLNTFELAFCITVHCSQGLSIDEAYSIWEWEKFSKKMKYTAITRARRYNDINLI